MPNGPRTKQSQSSFPPGRSGFTLVELLVVIAIIALLAAILFPVFNSVRDKSRLAQCETNLMQLSHAIAMYHDDWRVYPDALYGVSVNGGPVGVRLYAKDYGVKDLSVFACPGMPSQLSGNPQLVTPINPMTGSPAMNLQGQPIQFPAFDSYDSQLIGNNTLLNYTPKWTIGNPGLGDYAGQLYQRDPPGSTVVTWCLYHSHLSATGVPAADAKAPVLILSGAVKYVPAVQLVNWAGAGGQYPWQEVP